ncbi:MAG: pyridoxal phosphate-dependent aminotransferase [Bacteroidales bacterium]|nr:pyridoxal phosphate-dependent aminotransferase [Bacteroidales bacterium]MBQ5943694.1 pyridoxal phosphate-dependent aminotransferase [Bacteroidales bacterium]
MANISQKARLMPASAIRKLVPLSDAAKEQGVKVYHLNVGAPDIKSPSCALDAVKNNTMDHISYTNSAGLMELRKGMCEKYYKKIGIDLEPANLLMTVAGSEAVDMALKITCDQGDELVVMEPYYTNYNTFCFMNGITLKAVPTDIRDGFKVPPMSEFEKLITPRTKAILISNPGNPTGTLYSKEEVLALGELCKRHDIFLISDEVYREFCYTDQPHFSAMNIPGAEQNVILVDSVSKRYNLCGCRLGTIASRNADVMAAAMKYAQARLCPPVYGQLAAIGALDTPQEYFAAVREEYIRRRDFAVSALNSMPGVFSPLPMGAFYTIAEIPVDDAESFCRWMLSEFRVNGETTMVTPAASFYKTPGKGINHVRIAYVLEVEELKKAMNILAKGLEAYPGRTI